MKEYLSKIDFQEANGLFLLILCVVLLPFIVKNIFKKKKPPYLKLIPIYVSLIIIQFLVSDYDTFISPRSVGKNNPGWISMFVFIVLEYCIFAILLSKFIRAPFIKKFLIFSCPIYTVSAIITWETVSRLSKIYSITTTIESVVLIPSCLFYFYELFVRPPFFKPG